MSNALRSAIAERGAATLVVSGGRSPIAFFERLAQQELDWTKVTISPPTSAGCRSAIPTATKACCAAICCRAAAAARLVGLYQSAASLEQAAERAAAKLAELPPIDVLVLGMGEDGHRLAVSRQPEPGSGARPAWCAALPADRRRAYPASA